MVNTVAIVSTHFIKRRLVMKISVSSTCNSSRRLKNEKVPWNHRSVWYNNDHLLLTSKPRPWIHDSCAKCSTIMIERKKSQTTSAVKQTRSATRRNRSWMVQMSKSLYGKGPKITFSRPSLRNLKSRCSTHLRGISSRLAAKTLLLNSPLLNSPASVCKSRWP